MLCSLILGWPSDICCTSFYLRSFVTLPIAQFEQHAILSALREPERCAVCARAPRLQMSWIKAGSPRQSLRYLSSSRANSTCNARCWLSTNDIGTPSCLVHQVATPCITSPYCIWAAFSRRLSLQDGRCKAVGVRDVCSVLLQFSLLILSAP